MKKFEPSEEQNLTENEKLFLELLRKGPEKVIRTLERRIKKRTPQPRC